MTIWRAFFHQHHWLIFHIIVFSRKKAIAGGHGLVYLKCWRKMPVNDYTRGGSHWDQVINSCEKSWMWQETAKFFWKAARDERKYFHSTWVTCINFFTTSLLKIWSNTVCRNGSSMIESFSLSRCQIKIRESSIAVIETWKRRYDW